MSSRRTMVDGVEVGHETVDLDRPRACRPPPAERGGRPRSSGRAGVERATGFLEQDRLVDEREPAAAAVLGDGDAEPAELAELRERCVRVRLEERARLAAQLLLLLS